MPPSVLVVSDVTESGRQLVEEVLLPSGFPAHLDQGEGPPSDIILVDVSRLRGAPLAGLRARRAAGDTAPAILLATRLTEAMAAEVFRLGVQEYLVKPVDPGALGAAVAAVFQSTTRAATSEAHAAQLRVANENLQRRLKEMRGIAAIGHAVTQEHALDTVLTRVVEAATYLTGAEEGALFLVDPATGQLVLRASQDPGQVYAEGMRLRVDDTLAGQVFRTGKPVVRGRTGAEEGIKVKTGYLVNALVNVPLLFRSTHIGVLGVYNRLVERSFGDRQLEVLLALADWASIAIENARLVAHLEDNLTRTAKEIERLTVAVQRPAADLIPPTLRDGLMEISAEADAVLAAAFGPLEIAQAESLERIREKSHELLRQVDRLTGRDEEEAGSVWRRSTTEGLAELIRKTVSRLKLEAEARGLYLNADVSGEFPETSAPPDTVREMLGGLLSCAINRTHRGGVTLTAYQFRVRGGVAETPFPLPPDVQLSSGPWLAISIADTGPTPTLEARAALLTLPSAPEQISSGLRPGSPPSPAQIRRAAETSGGRLWVEAGVPDGLTFTLVLPGK